MDKSVLLVESRLENESLSLCALKNRNLGGEAAGVRDGDEAIDHLLAAGRKPRAFPQLILPDLELPEVDGLEVLRCLRSDDRTTALPVVMLTAVDYLNRWTATRSAALYASRFSSRSSSSRRGIWACAGCFLTKLRPLVGARGG